MNLPPMGCDDESIPRLPKSTTGKNLPVCTLAPLIQDGRYCLACHDIKELQSVALERVEFYFPGCPWQRLTQQSDDIFTLVEQELLRWPTLERISAAHFRIRLKNERRSHRIVVRPPLRLVAGRDGGVPVIDEWLQKRKFMGGPEDEGKPLEQS